MLLRGAAGALSGLAGEVLRFFLGRNLFIERRSQREYAERKARSAPLCAQACMSEETHALGQGMRKTSIPRHARRDPKLSAVKIQARAWTAATTVYYLSCPSKKSTSRQRDRPVSQKRDRPIRQKRARPISPIRTVTPPGTPVKMSWSVSETITLISAKKHERAHALSSPLCKRTTAARRHQLKP